MRQEQFLVGSVVDVKAGDRLARLVRTFGDFEDFDSECRVLSPIPYLPSCSASVSLRLSHGMASAQTSR
jgi:hypothetical protein